MSMWELFSVKKIVIWIINKSFSEINNLQLNYEKLATLSGHFFESLFVAVI